MSAKRYFLTGATGFVGAYLARRLVEDGCEVHVTRRAESAGWRLEGLGGKATLHSLDLLDPAAVAAVLARVRPTHLWHLATYGGLPAQRDPDLIARTNFLATTQLFHAAEKVGFEQFVHAGSSSEYGLCDVPMREDMGLRPLSAYGAAKAGATLYVSGLATCQGLPAHTYRLFSPYGPLEEPSRLIPTVLRAALRGETARLANGGAVRDFIYVEDVYRFFRAAEKANLPPGSVLNLGAGRQHTVRDVVEAAERALGRSIRVEWGASVPRPHEPRRWEADMARSRALVGWEPRYSLDEGIAETLRWMSALPSV